MTAEKTGFSAFLARKNIRISARLYFVDAMSAMAMGLFASLLIGTILEKTGASSATISRVNRSLNYGMGAYRILFDRMKEEEQAKQQEQQA